MFNTIFRPNLIIVVVISKYSMLSVRNKNRILTFYLVTAAITMPRSVPGYSESTATVQQQQQQQQQRMQKRSSFVLFRRNNE
jgi:hypothetical protein